MLSNAIKFTEKGKIELKIENLNSQIKVKVKDDGIGILQENLHEIFERFKQVDGSTTRKYGGTGLGLAICKELCLLLDIKISVQSELNKGTTFELLIPKNSKNIKNNSNLEKENIKIETQTKDAILVLNNNPILLMGLITQLNKKYLVKQTNSLEKLFDLAKDNKEAKIIIDITKLNDFEKDEINKNLTNSLIIIYSKEIEKINQNKIYKSLKIPFDIEELNSI